MVFLKLGLGFCAGVAVPFLVNEMTYMTIANSFLRPHLKYRIEKERLDKDKAIPTQMLDNYVKDVVGSFFLFFIAIGPVLYYSYVKKKQMNELVTKKDEVGKVEDDKYTQMLKVIKTKQAEKQQVDDQQCVPEPKITFEEYEAFLQRLEKDNKLDQLELQNPKSLIYQEMMNKNDLREKQRSGV